LKRAFTEHAPTQQTESKKDGTITPPIGSFLEKKIDALYPTAALTQKPIGETPNEPKIESRITIYNETSKKQIEVACPQCTRAFSFPVFMLNYIDSNEKLIRCCPYCNRASTPLEASESERNLWKEYFKS